MVLVDLNTTNGTFVNGVKVTRRHLAEGDCIGLGKASPHHFVFSTRPQADHREYVLPIQPVYRVGRATDNDLPLPQDPTVSSLHARLRATQGGLLLEDMGSANGTYVNGQLVRTAVVSPADGVRIGSIDLSLRLGSDGLHVTAAERRNQLRLEARDLVRFHGNIPLLRNINLVIEPGEYVGVLGPSGAGKSTLLNALNGFQPANKGQVLLNDVPLYTCYDMFRNAIGYVPQDDIIHGELAVERSLMYTAQLRLPGDSSREQLDEHVTSVIETLGLSHVRTNAVSRLSGGQRKRVSIGCELLTRPSVLFLDEPTSGLDPSTEEKLMRHFGRMAEQGQTVVLTTHILYNLDLLNLVVILARGRLVYFGPVSEVCNFFSSRDRSISRPIEIFDVLEPEVHQDPALREQRADEYQQKYLQSRLFQELVANRSSEPVTLGTPVELSSTNHRDVPGPPQRSRRTQALRSVFNPRQLSILVKRMFDLRLAFPSRLAVPLITPVVLGLLTATINVSDQNTLDAERGQYEQAQAGALSMLDQTGLISGQEFLQMKFEGVSNLAIPISLPLILVMTAVFLGTLSACLEISGERSVYMRERAVNLKIPLYVLSKLPYLFVLATVQSFLYVFVVAVLLGLTSVDVLSMTLVVIGVAWVSCVIGLFISSLDPTPGQNSVILAVIAVLPQLIFSGAMGPGFYRGMAWPAKALASLFPARWGFELMLSVLYKKPDWAEHLIGGSNPGQMGFRFGHEVFTTNAAALAILAAGFFAATCISLKRYDKL